MMGKRLFWVDDNAIHNGPDHEGYWLIDGGGYEATEPLYQKHPCDGNHFIPEGAKCLEPTWIRVWPKEGSDESH